MDKLWFRECTTGRRFIIKVEPGADLPAVLVDFARDRGLPFASLVSAVGSVRDVELWNIQAGAHLPMTEARFKSTRLEGPLELMGLEGNIAPGPGHELAGRFYLLASKSGGDVVGGRLVAATVFTACEIVLAEYLVEGVERHRSATSGVDTIYIEEG
jgi:predicted DNA-binding protein with PD1-like motif